MTHAVNLPTVMELSKRSDPDAERFVNRALRSCIKAHGPITEEWIGSAAKRVLAYMAREAKVDRPVFLSDISKDDLMVEVTKLRQEVDALRSSPSKEVAHLKARNGKLYRRITELEEALGACQCPSDERTEASSGA